MPDISDLDYLAFDANHRSITMNDRSEPDHWTMKVSTIGDTQEELALWMDGWTFTLGAGVDLAGELDAISADTAVFIPLVDGDRLTDDVELEGFGSRLVLINRVSLEPAWRGCGGVGRYLTGVAIRHLDHGAACVALHASPFELRDRYPGEDVPADEWEAGAAALGALWQTLGFRRHTGHLFVLDPAEVTLDHAVAGFKTRLIPDQE
ncbi:hypothetical protein [Rhodococcus sp. ARC_M6]|uniref:hypothetical protein n=1 Tax=Rhodococcus sp. ARC_M6 TaxID=2928852 RepID=UPI001FB23D69|nr:hypothetical protein [Rhodococcus sp. ARC_M6]MCJ0907328.1 hypothetical protein [Rhodococcus sp. ARC_M6]